MSTVAAVQNSNLNTQQLSVPVKSAYVPFGNQLVLLGRTVCIAVKA